MSEEIKLMFEGFGLAITLGLILWRLAVATTRFELIGTQQALEISEMKKSIDKIEAVLSAVAVQDAQIQTIREQNVVTQKRQDETNNRIFTILDRLQGTTIPPVGNRVGP